MTHRANSAAAFFFAWLQYNNKDTGVPALARKAMKTVMHVCGQGVALMLVALFATTANSATVGTGPLVEFRKAPFADYTQAENQDRITDSVWLTRADVLGMFNIAQEEGHVQFGYISPVDTEWAFQASNGNPVTGISAQDYESLVFTDWTNALGIQRVGDRIVGRPGVVHLISDDIYLDITFTEWGVARSGGGAFAYIRSSVVPIPAAAWMFGSALGLVGFLKRRPGG